MSELVRTSGDNTAVWFERQLAERFPAVAAEIDDFERGLLHLEMAVLARATSDAIESGDLQVVRARLSFIDELFSKSAPDLENATYVSYLENVFLGPPTARCAKARQMLSGRLETALVELEDHWKEIAAGIQNSERSE